MCGVFIDREMANEIEPGSVVLVSETAPSPNQRGGVFIEKEPNQIVLPSAFMSAAIAEARKKWRSFIQSSRSYGPVS